MEWNRFGLRENMMALSVFVRRELPDDFFIRIKVLRRTFAIRNSLLYLKGRKNILVISFF
jgi:hypothetical protein